VTEAGPAREEGSADAEEELKGLKQKFY